MFSCRDYPQILPFFTYFRFFQSPLTSPILPSCAEARVSAMANMQFLPSTVVSSLSYDPCVFVFIDVEAEVSSSWQFSIFIFSFVCYFFNCFVELRCGWHFMCHPKVGCRPLFKFKYVKFSFPLAIAMSLHNILVANLD
jgi:hypothetical protein